MTRHNSTLFALPIAMLALAMPSFAQAAAPTQTPVVVHQSSGGTCTPQVARQLGPRDPLRAPICKQRRNEFAGMGGPDCDPHYTGKGHEVWRMQPSFGPRAHLLPPSREWIESCSM